MIPEKTLNNWMKVNPNDNIVFKIFGKSGKLIDASSSLSREAEVLFKSATTFSVLNKKQYFDMRLLREITEITLKEK